MGDDYTQCCDGCGQDVMLVDTWWCDCEDCQGIGIAMCARCADEFDGPTVAVSRAHRDTSHVAIGPDPG